MSANIVDMLKRHEGTGERDNRGNFLMYQDTENLWTIGYGICIERTGLREHEAEYLLKSRIEESFRELNITFRWFRRLNTARQDALVDLIYNIGFPSFLGFKKAIEAFEVNDFNEAASQILDSRYGRELPGRALEISQMIKHGAYR